MKHSYGNLGTKFIHHSVDISKAQDNLEMTKFIHHSVENSNAQHLNETLEGMEISERNSSLNDHRKKNATRQLLENK